MKKIILAGAIVLFGLSNAQIKTGTVYISGQVSYSKEENKNINTTIQDFKIIPTAGVFVAKNLAVGTGIGFTNKKEEDNEVYSGGSFTTFVDYTGEKKAVVVAPFVRKYWTLSDNLYIFGQLEIPMEFGKINQDALVTYVDGMYGYIDHQTLSVETKYTSIGVNVKPGLDYFLNKNWSIEATIGEFGYKNFKYKEEGAKALNNYNFGLNLSSISFGVKYVFAK
ncbi:MAG: opacity protein [Chryseobacterium sp.]|uniref:porin family protein n=1 Tax=Chryseobacterium sp. TaxID=1871047 RepID=UPI000DB2FA06|nr:porin family protein [Chryseobacterium sp.]MPS64629.1 porin family protein [Chryseobacterium sp.]PZU15850.1 MAG: opacity protein [Chryseobacterium sp.]